MMNSTFLRPPARSGTFFRLVALALAPFALAPGAAALAPQDSTHLSWEFPKLEDEGYQQSPWIANGKVYYFPAEPGGGFSGKLRARNFEGELVFDYVNPKMDPQCRVSGDGRLYFLERWDDSNYRRVVILAPDGTRLGDFGPEGLGPEGGFSPLDVIAVSPVDGRVYVTDQFLPQSNTIDPGKNGLVRVFDRDGNYLHQFETSGILASTLEGPIHRLLIGVDEEGEDEVFALDHYDYLYYRTYKGNLKVFGGDGEFRRLATGGIFTPYRDYNYGNGNVLQSIFLWEDRLVFSEFGEMMVYPASVSAGSDRLAVFPLNGTAVGFNNSGGIVVSSNNRLYTYSYPNHASFDAAARNAVPNPWVLSVTQRPGGGIVDIDYRVDDVDDATVTTALVGFADGVATLNNVLPLNTLLEGTAAKIGANQPTGQVQRVTWDAGADWNVDFGTLRVMALARDSRQSWLDVHLVEIPADGDRPAVTISRNVMKQEDFLVQFLWLVATRDPSVNLVDGVLFGTTGAYDGVILADGAASTPKGREFLLARDGLRIATDTEVVRAREGATPNFVVALQPPVQMHRVSPAGAYPDKINEFGIEAGNTPGGWYVARAAAQ